MSPTPRQATQVAPQTPPAAPAHADVLEAMLRRTNRAVVPIRSRFVQKLTPGTDGTRAGTLATFVKAGAITPLKTFLFVHAMASASEKNPTKYPYAAMYSSDWWIRALDLNNGANDAPAMVAAKRRLSKTVKYLKDLDLIGADRQSRKAVYYLRDEAGDGSAYTRPQPQTEGVWTEDDDHWFNIPHAFWKKGLVDRLTLPGLAVYLIALSSKRGFTLPLERGPEWYGISRNTLQRGFADLEREGVIGYKIKWTLDPTQSAMNGWREDRMYTLKPGWHTYRRASAKKMSFQPATAASSAAETPATIFESFDFAGV